MNWEATLIRSKSTLQRNCLDILFNLFACASFCPVLYILAFVTHFNTFFITISFIVHIQISFVHWDFTCSEFIS